MAFTYHYSFANLEGSAAILVSNVRGCPRCGACHAGDDPIYINQPCTACGVYAHKGCVELNPGVPFVLCKRCLGTD